MIDIKTIKISDLKNGFIKLILSDRGFFPFYNCEISNNDKQIILNAIALRSLINDERKVKHIEKYQRANKQKEIEIDTKAMIGEYVFSKFLKRVNDNCYFNNIETITPPIAEMILNKKKQDFEIIEYKNDSTDEIINYLTFDIKSQFINNDYNYICVNAKSFERMKKQSEFFIICLIDGNQKNIDTNNNATFIFIKNDFFEKNSKLIVKSNSKKFSPYRRLNIELLLTKK